MHISDSSCGAIMAPAQDMQGHCTLGVNSYKNVIFSDCAGIDPQSGLDPGPGTRDLGLERLYHYICVLHFLT